MDKRIEFIFDGQHEISRKLSQQGVIYFEQAGSFQGLVFMSDWQKDSLEKLKLELQKSFGAGSFSAKLIGGTSFITSLEPYFAAQRWTVIKTVVRSHAYEVIWNAKAQKLQVSKEEVSAEVTIPVAAKPSEKIKVLVVDDSSTIRHLLESVLSRDPEIQVVALAEKPSDVEALVKKHKPDVMTLDIHMPEMDGVTLLKKLMPIYHIPTIMISSISKEEGPQVLNALEAGAVDYFQKPNLKELDIVAPQIIESVKTAARAKIQKKSKAKSVRMKKSIESASHLVVIGSSTGGTEALRVILEAMPEKIPPILITQHIPSVFSKALADRLNSLCPFEVKEAENNDLVQANRVLIAPGGCQMGVQRVGNELRIRITDDAPVNRHKPSVDYLFESVRKLEWPKVIGVILTGMGADGAKGLKALRDQGARTIAQDQETCVVFGMPREAIKLEAAESILPLFKVAEKICDLCLEKWSTKKAG